MSWMEQLAQAYDENERFAGRDDVEGMKETLAPIGHVCVNAQIDILLDENGNIKKAEVIAKDAARTLIPCTPDSASRTSGLAPHPLHDNLQYTARDYAAYVSGKKPKGGNKQSPYDLYREQLKQWADSSCGHPKIKAVYQYITRNDMIQDLVDWKILFKDEQGAILTKWPGRDKPALYREATGDVLKSFVRFSVDMGDGTPVELWKDRNVQQSYIRFCRETFSGERMLCSATGTDSLITEKHYKGIRFPGDGAKLISSNDSSGYTYRGRFETGMECAAIGMETSQKVMNALRWLIANQGYRNGEKVFLAWGKRGAVPPAPFSDTDFLVRKKKKTALPDTMKPWSEALKEALSGYRHDFAFEAAQINLIVLDAATSGRMSICYYSEMRAEDFIARIERWHTMGAWRQHKYDAEKKTTKTYYGVPAPKRIIEACYGDTVSDSQMNMALERLFYCIVNGRPVPMDMVRSAVGRVRRRAIQAVGDTYFPWWERLVEPACSLIRRQYEEEGYHFKEGDSVALDKESKNRSYLFGRLLAAADCMERATYSKEERTKRLTNAMKYMERFSQRPANTWRMLQMRLLPYEQKAGKYGYRTLLSEIGSQFEREDFISDAPLENDFLLGFYSQTYDIQQMIQEAQKRKQEKAEQTSGEN